MARLTNHAADVPRDQVQAAGIVSTLDAEFQAGALEFSTSLCRPILAASGHREGGAPDPGPQAVHMALPTQLGMSVQIR